ncbi:T9SS type A sorting domain-containing protein, partial [candidate division KSB1 bacterium]|nr:T9SS type A sorting domain-containing protein [candidate division KSB1 bacterium]
RTANLGDGGSTGGLDDRFDFILSSQSIIDQGGIDYVEDSYWAYGNDGEHFNVAIIDTPYAISLEIAFALHDVSDHLPVVAEFDFGVVSDVNDEIIKPEEFVLYQNYPNPFNPVTKIRFFLSNTSNVTLKIYDVLGHHIETLVDNRITAGQHEVEWNATGIASGVYLYQLQTDRFIESKKILVLK